MDDARESIEGRQKEREDGPCVLDASPTALSREVIRILLVDDDEGVLQAVATNLRGTDFEVETCANPAEILVRARTGKPDMLLLDLHFNEEHNAEGFEYLRMLRETGYQGFVAIWSGDCSLAMAHEAARRGANGYLVKCDKDMAVVLRSLLKPGAEDGYGLVPVAEAYLKTRGLTDQNIELLHEFTRKWESTKYLALELGRSYQTVRAEFKHIRGLLGLGTQSDLARLLGVLSCFARRCEQ